MSSSSSEDSIGIAREYIIDRFRREPAARVLTSDVMKKTRLAGNEAARALGILTQDGLLKPGLEARCEQCNRVASASIVNNGDNAECLDCGEVPHRQLVFYVATPAMSHLVQSASDPKADRPTFMKSAGQRTSMRQHFMTL